RRRRRHRTRPASSQLCWTPAPGWRESWSSGGGASKNPISVRERLGPVGFFAGIHLEEAAPVEAALGAGAAAHGAKTLLGGDAERGLAFPGSGRAIAGIEVIEASLQ